MTAAQTQAEIQSTRRTYTVLKPQEKYAVYSATGRLNAESIRELLFEALEARGWDRGRIRREYLRYVLRCEKDGVENLFPGGRV